MEGQGEMVGGGVVGENVLEYFQISARCNLVKAGAVRKVDIGAGAQKLFDEIYVFR